jgi:hypothetical protein
VFEIELLVAIHDVQSSMRVAFGGQQFAVGSEILLEQRNAERVPQVLALHGRQSRFTRIGENDDGVFHPPAGSCDLQHLLPRTGDGRRCKALGALVPSLREDARELGLAEPGGQHGSSGGGIDRMNKSCATRAASESESHGFTENVARPRASSQQNSQANKRGKFS